MSDQITRAITQLQGAVRESPSAAKAVFRATTSSHQDSFATTSQVRTFTLGLDEPEALGGADTGPNPVEAVLAALGSCQAIVYRAYANALGLRLDKVEVEARGHLDIRGFLGDSSVPAGFERVAFTTRVTSPEPAERIAELSRLVEAHCPVLDILRRAIPVTGALEHTRSSAAVAA